ncbi:BrnT family toxin [Stutzerimonas sp. NM35]
MDEFEFDEAKSQANLQKHGIDFVAAQGLWKDPYLLEIRAKSEDEQRFLLVGKIGAKHWSAVVTYRPYSPDFSQALPQAGGRVL